MLNFIKKTLAAVLVLALVLSVVPAVATTAQAADGDITSGGYVLFEETFDTNVDGTLKSGHTYAKTQGTLAVADGYLTDTNGTTKEYITFTVNNVDIPRFQGDRCYLAIKIEVDVAEATGRSVQVQVTPAKTADGTAVTGKLVDLYNSSSLVTAETAYSLFYLKNDAVGNIASFGITVGGRPTSTTTNSISIDAVRISLVTYEISGKEAMAQDMGMYLQAGTGYFQLQRDMTFDGYTVGNDLVMGNNAVLDLNGHTLTIADGSTLKAAGNAKIVDSSANKTGKIVCGDGALTIANTAHPTLPIRTADGYVFVEPKLIADQHMLVVEGSQTADKFTLHFRPGFGQEIRENYLSKGNSGIQMSAYITSEDIYGNRYDLQYNGSKEIVLDGMFDGMYASAEARGQMMFEGFEKYQSLEITLKLTAGGASCTLPTYTVNNTKVTKHFASKFDTIDGITNTAAIADGQLKVTGTANINLANAITTGAGNTMVMEFDATIANTLGAYEGGGFEVRGTNVDGSPRYYLFNTGIYAEKNGHHYIVQKNYVGTKHIADTA